MRNLLLLLICSLPAVVFSQLATPDASPLTKIEQRVGLTDVTLEYSRPSMKGRVIYGDLVPFDKLWRTGANARTKITFGHEVTVHGKNLAAGSYALLTIPGKNKWEIILYTEHQGGGAPAELDPSKVAARFSVTPVKTADLTETFTIEIGSLTTNGATVFIRWEDTMVPFNFTVPTDQKVMASINQVLSGPSAMDYFRAASYYYAEGKDINQAKTWIDKALGEGSQATFWQLRQQSLIYAKAGDKKGAIEIAKKSLAAAEKAGNADYVKMNKDSLKEWGAN